MPQGTPITSQNGHAIGAKSLAWRKQGGISQFWEAVELQQLMLKDARDPDLKPLVRAGIARAYVELEMLKLRLRMKPAPKPVDVSKPRKSQRKAAAFVELPQSPEPPPKL